MALVTTRGLPQLDASFLLSKSQSQVLLDCVGFASTVIAMALNVVAWQSASACSLGSAGSQCRFCVGPYASTYQQDLRTEAEA